MNTKLQLIIVSLAAVLSACSTSEQKATPSISDALLESSGQNGRACVRQNDIRGYGVLDNKVISIDGRRNYYLATVLPGCHSLSTAGRARFEEHFSEVCGGGTSKVYAGGDQCTIRHLFEFDNREAAFEAYEKAGELRKEGPREER